jgi:hypothetical protein
MCYESSEEGWPGNVAESQDEIRDTEAVRQEATFYCAGTDPADSCPKG